MKKNSQLIMGIPGSGKTTFLAALYHVLESRKVPESLQLVDLGDSREYLVSIRDKWLGCIKMERTKLGEEKIVKLKLQSTDTQAQTDIILPDLSGESFRDQWEKRKSIKIFDDLAMETPNIIFFIHPDTIRQSVRINKSKMISKELDDYEPKTKLAEEKEIAENAVATPWEPKFAPTQVQLIELLQFLLREPTIYPFSKLAIVISAWDIASKDHQGPSQWLEKRTPMFYQFLQSNADRLEMKMFGISAQGGELSDDPKRHPDLLRKRHERIQIVTDVADEGSPHDITRPIKWLMQSGTHA